MIYVDGTSLDKISLNCMYVDISMIGGLQVNASNVMFVKEIETGVVRTAMNIWINEKKDFGLFNIEYTLFAN